MHRVQNWWNQACGPREILAIALPLIISTISYTVMQFCDRMFLSWYSTEALAAVLPAGAIFWTLCSLPFGVTTYCSTFVAQYHGARRDSNIGPIVWQAIWLGILAAPIYLLIGVFGESLFLLSGHEPEFAELENDYLLASMFGAGAFFLDSALSAFFIGRGKTVVVMLVNFVGTAINIVLDYLLIFGCGELPELGLWGAGLATSVALWAKVAILGFLFFRADNGRFGHRHHWQLNVRLLGRLLKFGLPNGMQFLVEGVAITFFFLVIPRISELASAASSIVFSINMLAFYPVIGLGIGCSTLVGQKIGEQQTSLASRAAWNSFALGMIYTIPFAICYVAIPDFFIQPHSIESADFDQIRGLVVLYLRFVALYCLFDVVQIIFVSAVKGAGDTRFVVLITLLTGILFILTGVTGAKSFADPLGQVNWWWICLTGWIFALGATYLLRFLQGKWKRMTVIER